MASKGSCSVGGNLATNAGGIQVVRYGNTRDLCLGIEAVLPCGSILSDLSPLHKDNTGYDLKHLLIGSEGTLGVITAATFKLTPLDPETVTMLCAVSSPTAALALYKKLRLNLRESISALELMSDFGLDLVASCFSDLKKPFKQDYSWYVLIEAGGAEGIIEQALGAVADCLETGLVQDAVIAQSGTQRATLWRLRENTPEANRLSGAFVSSDTSVPISKVEAFIHATCAAVKAINPDLRVNTYGHIGDGNIHHNILPPQGVTKAAFLKAEPDAAERIRMVINDATVEFGGSISAEHGIGRLKTQDLEAYVSPVKRRALKAIKSALDPNNIMNPGAVLR
jgi:FAD/FMN-containing dehydrogenase